jgi:heptosyltransferase-3
MHTVEQGLKFLDLLELSTFEKKVHLYSNDKSKQKIETILENEKIEDFIIIHPVSRWMFKCWDDEKFAKIIDYIELNKKKKVIITASPDPIELDRIESILKNCKSNPLNLSGLLSLDELSALIARASLFVGVDTAPMHMAAALNIPIIALFGPSNPILWGPWDNETQKSEYTKTRSLQTNGKHVIIQHPNDEIIYHNGRKTSTSMMEITTDEVIEQIDKKL